MNWRMKLRVWALKKLVGKGSAIVNVGFRKGVHISFHGENTSMAVGCFYGLPATKEKDYGIIVGREDDLLICSSSHWFSSEPLGGRW